MKEISRYLMGLLYIAAGVNHFWHPVFYLNIMPPWLPYHSELVQISGICEIICGLLVLYNRTVRLGAWLTILLLIAVFPANIQMAIDRMHYGDTRTWLAIVRLPVQLVLIWWAWLFTKRHPLTKTQ